MDIVKHAEIYDPTQVETPIIVIGCGAVGSTVAELLARAGLTRFKLYDFDAVEPKNIANQSFLEEHIGRPKAQACKDLMKRVNSAVLVNAYNRAWTEDDRLSGHVFMCVDSMDARRLIMRNVNEECSTVIDFRMGLFDGQVHSMFGADPTGVGRMLKTMAYTDEEAEEATPRSACGETMSVRANVVSVACAGVANFQNYTIKKTLTNLIIVNYYDRFFVSA
jgi:molybdopterin/thiamine biosynthesis adenylyltransferase